MKHSYTFSMEKNAKGKLPYRLTNDYLFRALLQKSNKTLKGLVCSLLHLKEEDVVSVEITNPIELGESMDAKTFFLDIKILLNGNTLINMEMQVLNEGNWPERSLSYLCRSFDHLNKGQNYDEIMPVVHIGFLNYTLFPKLPEFYSTYMLMNVKNNSIYSDKIKLSMIDLTKIDMATDEDKFYHIDYWAALFKATTWEDMRMLAQNNEYIKEATNTVYELTADEKIRLQCEAREEYYRSQRTLQNKLEKANAEIELLRKKIEALEESKK